MHSQNGNSSKGGDERHWIPLAKMMGGCIPPIPPPLTPLVVATRVIQKNNTVGFG